MIFINLFINVGKKFDTLQNNHLLKTKISEIKYHSPNKNSPLLKLLGAKVLWKENSS